ncbi:AGAP008714-PA, partial [Anopheles gambiae str. PEST]
MLAVIDRAIELKRGFRLRDTQRLTVLALLVNDKSTLAQVSTGEGKTIIVVAITIIKVLLGEKVDIITSSSVLAKRDADENKDIYALFGFSASHNCSEVIEERKEAYSSNQIIYGDLGNFQRDYLLDRVYGKNVLGDRSFQNVIVDEVDSMLLDKGNNILYLSHDIAGMDKLESVFVFIWQMVNSATDQTEDVSSQWDEAMHQFLQLKHGCKLSTLSLKAVFISNVTYFKEYELLYGLTGTLGTNEERELLKKMHDVDFVTVPTFKMKQFEEYGSIICSGSEDWKQEIRREVTKLAETDKRSVLMICETVQDVEALQNVFSSDEQSKVHTYKRDYEELTIAKDGLESGRIIIATNLAGRGTDIK